jgi:hypothetical protein
VSAFSLSSIKAKKELQEHIKATQPEEQHFAAEPFTITEMLLHWYKYADRIGEKGQRIMASLLTMNDPTLDGTKIKLELPNEGSKLDFESEKNPLLGYLKGHLHNHNITIDVVVNEIVEKKFAFTPQDKYKRLVEINPNLEKLKKVFDLDL